MLQLRYYNIIIIILQYYNIIVIIILIMVYMYRLHIIVFFKTKYSSYNIIYTHEKKHVQK